MARQRNCPNTKLQVRFSWSRFAKRETKTDVTRTGSLGPGSGERAKWHEQINQRFLEVFPIENSARPKTFDPLSTTKGKQQPYELVQMQD